MNFVLFQHRTEVDHDKTARARADRKGLPLDTATGWCVRLWSALAGSPKEQRQSLFRLSSDAPPPGRLP